MTSIGEALAILVRMVGGLEGDDTGFARLMERVGQQPDAEVLPDVVTDLSAAASLRGPL